MQTKNTQRCQISWAPHSKFTLAKFQYFVHTSSLSSRLCAASILDAKIKLQCETSPTLALMKLLQVALCPLSPDHHAFPLWHPCTMLDLAMSPQIGTPSYPSCWAMPWLGQARLAASSYPPEADHILPEPTHAPLLPHCAASFAMVDLTKLTDADRSGRPRPSPARAARQTASLALL